MKSIKHFALILMAAIMAFVIPFASACKTDEPNPEPGPGPAGPATTELLGIEVDTSKVKTVFYVGEAFTSSGLIVMRETKRSDRDRSETSDVSASAVVDSSEFRNRVGEYSINVSYTLGEVTKSDSYSVTVKDVSLSLDLTNVKTDYLETEEFTSEGLTVAATVVSPNAEPVTEDVTSKITVDSSEYKSVTGTYPITVNYRIDAVTRSASYNVKVGERKEGLNVALADGVSDTINLSATTPTATIDPSKIVVRAVDYYGNVITTEDGLLSAADYTIKVFKDGDSTPLMSYSNLTAGVYQIWAYKDSELDHNFELSGFAIIYVVDEIASLVKTAGETEQIAGNDSISATWQFEATYASGKKVTLKADDVKNNIDTKAVGENKTATVTYNYVNAKGVAKTVSVDVTYTIKAKPAQSGDVTYNMTYQVKTTDASAKTGGWETKWSIDSEDLDKNVTITTTTANYLTKAKSTTGDNVVTFSDYAEVKDYAKNSITINVGAKATGINITVYFSHTSKAERALYLASDTTIGDANANVIDTKTIGTTSTAPSTLYTLSGTNLSAGKYYIYSDSSTVHVYAIVVEYTVKGEAETPAEPVVANIGEFVGTDTTKATTYSTETKLAEGIYFTASSSSTVAIDANTKSFSEDNITSTYRLKLSGQGSATARSLKIETTGAATITVYMMSSSNKTESDWRQVGLYDSTFTIIGTAQTVKGADLEKHEYTVTAAGTYYIAAASGGTNVYCVVVTPSK